MGRFNWTQAATGRPNATRVGTGGGNFITQFQYEIGDLKRVIIPALIDEEGHASPVIFQAPVHQIDRGTFTLTGSKGGQFTPYSIRCMHPLSQTDQEVTKELAEHRQYCVPCLMASLANKEYFAEMNEEFGNVDGYNAASKEAKKVFNDRMKARPQIRPSYETRIVDEVKVGRTNYAMEMLVLVLDTEVTEKTSKLGIKSKTTVAKRDGNGNPIYSPHMIKVSETRLGKFETAVQSALQNGILGEEDLYLIEEGNGNQVLTTFVDFELHFPVKDSKMKSAAEMTVRAVRKDETVISPDFIKEVQEKSEELLEKSDSAFKFSNLNLKRFTTEEYINAMTDGGARYQELKEKYFDESDKEFIGKVFRTALGERDVFKKEEADEQSATALKQEAPASKAEEVENVEVVDNVDDLLSI